MQIQKGKFKWRDSLTPLNLNKVVAIALHHMAHSTADEYEVEKWHLERENGKWKGFGYNYWIGLDGRIVEGRGLNQGAGVEGKNSTIISIGFQGDYEKMPDMPDAQYKSGVWLIQHLMEVIPSIKAVDGHFRWSPSKCPGRYFPLAKMIQDSTTSKQKDWKVEIVEEAHKEGLITDLNKWVQDKDEPMSAWAVLAVALNLLKRLGK